MLKLKHLARALSREARQEELAAREVAEERSFWRSGKCKTWTDSFGDTVFPEFDKPETWNPNEFTGGIDSLGSKP